VTAILKILLPTHQVLTGKVINCHGRFTVHPLCRALFELAKPFGVLIEEIERNPGYNVAVLSRMKEKTWRAMCSYAHGGFLPVVRRIIPGEITTNYSDEEKLEVIKSSDTIALFARLRCFRWQTAWIWFKRSWSECAAHPSRRSSHRGSTFPIFPEFPPRPPIRVCGRHCVPARTVRRPLLIQPSPLLVLAAGHELEVIRVDTAR
jgi:hypothetical protein